MQLNLIHDKIDRDVEVIFKIERNGGVPIGCPLGATQLSNIILVKIEREGEVPNHCRRGTSASSALLQVNCNQNLCSMILLKR